MALLRQLATVAGGSAAGQLVVFATTPLLARIYSPAEFGEYAAFLAICNVFLATACFRYDTALNAAEDDSVAPLFGVACIAALLTALAGLVATATPWGSVMLARVAGEHAASWRFAAAAATCGIYQATSAMAIRHGKFALSSALRLLQPVAFATAALVLPFGLIDSCLIGFLVALPFAVHQWVRIPVSQYLRIAPIAKAFRQFPTLSLPTAILDALSLAMPVWFISSRYSAMDAGNYAQVQRLLAAPLLLAALAVSQVYLKRAGDLVRAQQSALAFQRQLVMFLALGATALMVAVALLGSFVLHLFLGEGWRTDTLFLVLVFVPVAVRCCVSPITGIFIIRNRLRLGAFWQVVYFCVTSVLLFSLAGRIGIEQLLMAYAMSETLCYGLYLYIADQVAK